MAEEKKTPEQKEQETLMAAMGLIANGGNAKSLAFEAIRLAKKGDIAGAREKLKESDKSLLEAHNSQTGMLTKEAQGDEAGHFDHQRLPFLRRRTHFKTTRWF